MFLDFVMRERELRAGKGRLVVAREVSFSLQLSTEWPRTSCLEFDGQGRDE